MYKTPCKHGIPVKQACSKCRTDAKRPFDRLVMRPGPGWKCLGGGIWEHDNGTRISLLGVVRLPDMTFYRLNHICEGAEGYRMIRINGGNRKRGLMAWARSLVAA